MLNECADMIHIGKRIKKVVKERGMTVVDFARAMPCSRENVYKIFRKDNIDIKQLAHICQVLSHDFFLELSECSQFLHM